MDDKEKMLGTNLIVLLDGNKNNKYLFEMITTDKSHYLKYIGDKLDNLQKDDFISGIEIDDEVRIRLLNNISDEVKPRNRICLPQITKIIYDPNIINDLKNEHLLIYTMEAGERYNLPSVLNEDLIYNSRTR